MKRLRLEGATNSDFGSQLEMLRQDELDLKQKVQEIIFSPLLLVNNLKQKVREIIFSRLLLVNYLIQKVRESHSHVSYWLIISPNEVLAPQRLPVDPDDVNTLNLKNIQRISFKFGMWVDTP